MNKLWDGEPEVGPTAGEIKSGEDAQAYLEKQRSNLRRIANQLADQLKAATAQKPGRGN